MICLIYFKRPLLETVMYNLLGNIIGISTIL
jgi:hypothetical protein